MRRLILITLLLAIAIPVPASAQTMVSVDINRAQFEFTWQRGTNAGVDDGIPTAWRFYCGDQPGAPGSSPVDMPYVAPPTGNLYIQPIRAIIKQPGSYYCSVLGVNQFGEGLRSNEVPFAAGTVPTGPTGLSIRAQ